METLSTRFDPKTAEWVRVSDPDFDEYKIDYEYSILGYDLSSQRLDMLLRFTGNGGHCLRHRHVATTATLVLKGEQHLEEYLPDGTKRKTVRKAGDYALSGSDSRPHMEHGGLNGCTLFMSLHAPDGILFEYMDEDLGNVRTSTVEQYVERWKGGGAVTR